MLQGRYGASGWRRQIRLEAYTGFLTACNEFNDCVRVALEAVGEVEYDEKLNMVREAEKLLSRAGAVVTIVGPISADAAAALAGLQVQSILMDLVRVNSEASQKALKGKLRRLGADVGNFAKTCRGVLKTQRSDRWLS